MSENIRRYLEGKCLIIYLLCIFVNFNLEAVMPNVFLLATGNWFDQFDYESCETWF